ncbi:ribosome biogenesis factor YjgA, partial [Xanthomonas oryzae]
MRGRDEDTGEFRGASRSQQRREALEIFDLGEKLVALTPAQLAKLPVPESLIQHIEESKRITSHIAHKRQLAFLAKHMRREDDETLAAIRDAL